MDHDANQELRQSVVGRACKLRNSRRVVKTFSITEQGGRAPILSSGIFSAGGRGRGWRAVIIISSLISSPQTVLRIVVLGIWDYIENKIEVKTSVDTHPPHWPSWELENVPLGGTLKKA